MTSRRRERGRRPSGCDVGVIKFQHFGGMIPAVDDRLLPETAAAVSRDAFLYSGRLEGWRKPKLLFTLLGGATRKAYRIPVDSASSKIGDPSYWVEFDDADTDVVRSPTVDDSFERYYFASPAIPPAYNTKARIAADLPAWVLGVPAPISAPSVGPAGGGLGLAVARSYVYTYVTEYGEEGPPSDFTLQNGFTDDTWTIDVTAPAANDMGVDRNITAIRIYRTVTGATGSASFFLVAELDTLTLTYDDTLSDATVALNVELPSTTWEGPPSDLQGIVQAPNGMLVGFRTNEVWFCEPFRPHAWPSIYTISTEFPIVGLGVVGQSIVACTKGYPVILQGNNPNTVTDTAIRISEPCTCRGGILSSLDGVYYPSANGLIKVTPFGQVENVTLNWITREEWADLVPLRGGRAIRVGPAYVTFGSVFVDPDTDADNGTESLYGASIDLTTTAPAAPRFGELSAPDDISIYNAWLDFWTATPLIIQDGKVWYYDFADTDPEYLPFLWRSKIFQDVSKRNYEAMRIWFDVPDSTPAQNGTRNTDPTQTLADDQYGIVRVYADGVLRTTRELRTSGELLRIASGFKTEFWQWEFEGRVKIIGAQVAHTVKELSGA